MDINWSAFDGFLGIALVIVLIWAGLRLMSRLVVAVVVVLVLAAVFFGVHFEDFGFGG